MLYTSSYAWRQRHSKGTWWVITIRRNGTERNAKFREIIPILRNGSKTCFRQLPTLEYHCSDEWRCVAGNLVVFLSVDKPIYVTIIREFTSECDRLICMCSVL